MIKVDKSKSGASDVDASSETADVAVVSASTLMSGMRLRRIDRGVGENDLVGSIKDWCKKSYSANKKACLAASSDW